MQCVATLQVMVVVLGADRVSVLQEVAWFDKEENASGVLSSQLAVDTAHIRGAVGEGCTNSQGGLLAAAPLQPGR